MLPAIQILLAFTLLKSVAIEGNFITSDYLQNTYIITKGNNLQKLDSAGNLLFHYNQNRFGELKSVDATNPLKIVLSYPDYGTIVWLDNTLTEVGVLSTIKLGINSYSAICFSPKDNNIWVFDDQEYKLRKIDNNGNIILESSDMFQILGHAIYPVFMLERDQFIYISDPQLGILVFDAFGIYKETLPIGRVSKFMVRNNELYYWEDNYLFIYGINSLEEKYLVLPDNSKPIDLSMESNLFFLLQKEKMNIYRY